MIWARTGHKHWTSNDVTGLMMDVRVTKESVELIVINAETGEILKTAKHEHPIEAMNEAKMIEATHASNQKVCETSTSKNAPSIAETSSAI